MKNTPHHIAALSEALAQWSGYSPSTLSRFATGSGDIFDRIQNGHGITYQRLERIFQYFSDNWPDDLPWPKNIDRPTPHPLAPEQKLKARGCKCA
ncbi:MAG: hypothetical protein P1U50_10960 [Parvibaculaceae bacterium]|nr:hypothetical protein [Parvibaculaceae bacterium]